MRGGCSSALLQLLKASAMRADVEGMGGLDGVLMTLVVGLSIMLGVTAGAVMVVVAGVWLVLVVLGAQWFGVLPCFRYHSALAAA